MKYPSNPEIIVTVDGIDNVGNEISHGDKIVGVGVMTDKGTSRDGTINLDIRDFARKQQNLIVRIPLPEFMAALTSAILNAERNE